MKLTINKAYNLLNLVLPSCIDGKKFMPADGGGVREVPHLESGYCLAGKLKYRDVRNRRKLREVMEAFEGLRRAAATRLMGEPADMVPPDHEKHAEFLAECNRIGLEEVEVDLRPYPISQFKLDKNDHYPSGHLDWLDREGLLEFDDEEDQPPAAEAAEAAEAA